VLYREQITDRYFPSWARRHVAYGSVAAYIQQAWMAADNVHIVAHGMLKYRSDASSHNNGVVAVSHISGPGTAVGRLYALR